MTQTTRQPILGFLVDDLLSQYQVRLLMGLQRAARKHRARLISIPAGWFSDGNSRRFDGSFLFNLARPPAIDGVILEASIMATEVGVDGVQAFCKKLGLPTVSVSSLEGYPWVDANASAGLRQAIEHLIFVHDRRRLCFIRGPAGNSHSQEREQIFRSVVREHGLPLREEWILPGDFLEGSGAQAITTLIKDRRVSIDEIDGIVAANDLMAVGAMGELAARNVHVPRDIAVVGFDDDDLARHADPPVTTVAQLVERIGAKAVELLLDLMAGRPINHANLVDVELVIRRSCGCAEPESASHFQPDVGLNLTAMMQSNLAHCKQRLSVFFGDTTGEEGVDAIVQMVTRFEATSVSAARHTLEQAIRTTADQGLDPLRWHDIVQPLETTLLRHSLHPQAALFETRLVGARLHIGEIAAHIKAFEALRGAQCASALRVLGSALVSTRSLKSLGAILDVALPGLGVSLCYMWLFEDDPARSLRVKLAARYINREQSQSTPIQRSGELWRMLSERAPPNLPVATEAADAITTEWPLTMQEVDERNLVVYPLVFADERLGYVVFSEPCQVQDAWLLEGIAGHLSGAVHAMRDAERLGRAREVAEAANVAKGEFVAMISNELRTPLTAMMGHLDLSLRADLSGDVRARLGLARSSSQALLCIVNDLLDFSKMEAGRLEVESVRFDLDDVLKQVINACGIGAARKGLELVFDLDPDVPNVLVGDPLRLSQVLVNLTANSVKFSLQGEIVIRIEHISSPTSDSITLRYSVRDTGIGMSEAETSKLFQPFTQGDQSTTRRYGGTGLGLAICKRLVSLMGGDLRAQSEEGKGSTFSFDLTCFVPELISAPEGMPLRVLLVEDNESQRQALVRALDSLGCTVTETQTIGGARRALNRSSLSESFQLTLLDATLPDGDSMALAAELSTTPHHTDRVVVMTSMATHMASDIRTSERTLVSTVSKPLLPSGVLKLARRAARHEGLVSLLPPSPASSDSATLAGYRILLVQDNEVTREVLREMLHLSGASVQVSVDGGHAVHQALSEQFDLVLMDLHLPVMDGFAAARAIRMDARYADVPILALTASADPDNRARCLAAGMNDCVTTPIELQQLSAVIKSWLTCAKRAFATGLLRSQSSPNNSAVSRDYGLNTTSGIAGVGGNEAYYQQMLRRFIHAHETIGHNVAEALRQGEDEKAAGLVHALVSAAGFVGATRLCFAAHALELSLRRAPRQDDTSLVEELRHALEQTLIEARAFLGD
jgi:signal transduction histidine kinase/DNA-binding LacI/PurR family transcriptional regulator/DNA-binding response OmpR family regulator